MDIITNKNYKYGVEILSADSEEFKRVEEFSDNCRCLERQYDKYTVQNFQIFKVIEKNPVETLKEKRNNLKLFHRTKECNVHSILENGFKNSEKGWYGKVN